MLFIDMLGKIILHFKLCIMHTGENEDFWLIKDACLTELEPEEYDENGVGRTLTCIGFKPLPDEIAHQISKKFQLYRG